MLLEAGLEGTEEGRGSLTGACGWRFRSYGMAGGIGGFATMIDADTRRLGLGGAWLPVYLHLWRGARAGRLRRYGRSVSLSLAFVAVEKRLEWLFIVMLKVVNSGAAFASPQFSESRVSCAF